MQPAASNMVEFSGQNKQQALQNSGASSSFLQSAVPYNLVIIISSMKTSLQITSDIL